MNISTCHTVIAGSTPPFRSRLKKFLRMTEQENPSISVEVLAAPTLERLEKLSGPQTGIVLIDADMILGKGKKLASLWKQLAAGCSLVLLFSNSDAADLEKAIYEICKQKNLPHQVHVLKDNYPDDIMHDVLEDLVKHNCQNMKQAAA